MQLQSIRRYPVKAMGGEDLDQVEIDRRGLVGDRWYAVTDADGRLATGKDSRRFRRRDAVFDFAAETDPNGVSVRQADSDVDVRQRVGTEELDHELSVAMGAAVRVLPEAAVAHQDGGSVSLVGTATLDWCTRRWGIEADPRRLRVNLVIETEEPFVEEGWIGQLIGIGSCRLRAVERIERCRTVDLDQDGAEARGRWLKPLAAEREMSLAVYADVEQPGTIRVGDRVSVG